MAYSGSKFTRISGGVQSDNSVTLYSYDDGVDNLATIKGSGYFDTATELNVNDLIYAQGSDDRDVLYVVSLAPVVTAEYNSASVADGSITEAKLAANSVTEAKMDAATAAKLLSVDAVDATHIAANAVGSSELATGAVDTNAIAANAVTEGKLATGVTDKLLGVDAVDATHIAANAVGTSEIANGSVTEAKLDAPTAAKLLSTGAVTADHLAANSITEADFDAPTAAKLLSANSVGTTEIQNGSVTGVKLANGLVPRAKQIYTTTGGSSTENVTIAGVVATDIVSATLHTVGSTPRQLDTAASGAGQVVLTFSGDPSTDHKVNILVYAA